MDLLMTSIKILIAITFSIIILSCSSTQTNVSPADSKSDDCSPTFHGNNHTDESVGDVISEFSFTNSDLTRSCTREEVLETLKRSACLYGAKHVIIKSENEVFRNGRNCYEASVTFNNSKFIEDVSQNSNTQISKSSCAVSSEKGKIDGKMYNSSALWWVAGVGSGFGLGLIGTAAIFGLSYLPNPTPDMIPKDLDQKCYRDSYRREVSKSNHISALIGGVLGTVGAVLYVTSK
jgi:hypothetical protein